MRGGAFDEDPDQPKEVPAVPSLAVLRPRRSSLDRAVRLRGPAAQAPAELGRRPLRHRPGPGEQLTQLRNMQGLVPGLRAEVAAVQDDPVDCPLWTFVPGQCREVPVDHLRPVPCRRAGPASGAGGSARSRTAADATCSPRTAARRSGSRSPSHAGPQDGEPAPPEPSRRPPAAGLVSPGAVEVRARSTAATARAAAAPRVPRRGTRASRATATGPSPVPRTARYRGRPRTWPDRRAPVAGGSIARNSLNAGPASGPRPRRPARRRPARSR